MPPVLYCWHFKASYRGSYMSAPVLLNLSKLRNLDKMGGFLSILKDFEIMFLECKGQDFAMYMRHCYGCHYIMPLKIETTSALFPDHTHLLFYLFQYIVLYHCHVMS